MTEYRYYIKTVSKNASIQNTENNLNAAVDRGDRIIAVVENIHNSITILVEKVIQR